MKVAAIFAVVAALGLVIIPSVAVGLSPQSVCRDGANTGAPDAALFAAANITETILRSADSREKSAALEAALQVSSETSTLSTPHAVAVYCAAAGEAERTGLKGSPYAAQAWLRVALKNAEQAKQASVSALSAYRLGLASLAMGETVDGRGVRARRSARGSPNAESVVTGGDICGERSNQSVSTALQCAATRASAAGDADLSALANLRLARLLLTSGNTTTQTDEPGAIALAALVSAAQAPEPARRVELLGRLVEVAIDAGRSADPALTTALIQMHAAAGVEPGGLAFEAGLRGRIALMNRNRAAAAALFQRAVFLEGQHAQPARLALWYLRLAEADIDLRSKTAHVTAAYNALESVRPTLPLRDLLTEESSFSLYMQPVFEAAVDLALPIGDREVPVAADIQTVQSIVEAYRQAEIQSAFGGECLPPLPEPMTPSDLRAGELVLYPILLRDRVELLYAVGGKPGGYRRLEPVRLSRDQVTALVDMLVRATKTPAGDQWRGPARALYDLLIKPIEGDLSTAAGTETTLVIMPDGPLRAVPFGALLAGEADGRSVFLIEKTRLAVAPALAYAQPGSEQAGRRARVVAASLEMPIDSSGLMFPELAGVGAEAEAAADLNGASRGVWLRNFTNEGLDRELARGRVDVLHLATHALFNGGSERTFILAKGEGGAERIPLADLRRMISRSRVRGDALDLIVLSACETAVGDDQTNMGLAGAAVQAGARSALASLWQVNDDSTADLMRMFYARYRSGDAKAEALRRAQLSLIAGGNHSHPSYWAAFSLIGGWR